MEQNEITEATMANITDLAGRAAAAQAEQDAAHTARIEAETALLDRIFALVRPALRAISKPLLQSSDWDADNDCPDDEADDVTFAWRGVVIDGLGDAGPSRVDSLRDSGRYGAHDLVFCDDGMVRLVTYRGHWSKWQGSSSGWTTDVEELDTRRVALRVDPEVVVAALTQRLTKAVEGDSAKRAAKNRARAAKLAAIVALMAK